MFWTKKEKKSTKQIVAIKLHSCPQGDCFIYFYYIHFHFFFFHISNLLTSIFLCVLSNCCSFFSTRMTITMMIFVKLHNYCLSVFIIRPWIYGFSVFICVLMSIVICLCNHFQFMPQSLLPI